MPAVFTQKSITVSIQNHNGNYTDVHLRVRVFIVIVIELWIICALFQLVLRFKFNIILNEQILTFSFYVI